MEAFVESGVVAPTTNMYSNSLSEPSMIRPLELDAIKPESVASVFDRSCATFQSRVAMNQKVNGRWQAITYKEYQNMVRCCAKGFLSLGLKPNTVVCILGFNSPEWFVSDLGAIYAGGVAAGIYTTNSAEACLYCLNHSKAIIIVVESAQLSKILQIRSQAKTIKAIIIYGGKVKNSEVITWDRFMRMGAKVSDSVLAEARRSISVNKCCTLVYTSGTTGHPKGTMLSHDNVVYDAIKIGEKFGIKANPVEVYVSYLPLSHVAGNIVDIHCCYMFGVRVYFAERDALKGSLIQTFVEVRPTRILSVPRVWEKVYEKFQEKAAQTKGLKRIIAKWAKNQGRKRSIAIDKNEPCFSFYPIAKFLVYRPVKKVLGIENCKTIISGAAPLAADIKLYLASLDIFVCDAFGMSESSALHCGTTPKTFKFESCGTTCKGMLTKIKRPDDDGNGELCMYGRHVFMGYLDDEAQTLEALDKDGYLHSGDLARVDSCGFIYITGRLKELIITAGGENVAPVVIEQHIKTALPFVGHAVVIGDRKKFLTVLLTFTAETDANQEPTNVVARSVKMWLDKLDLNYTTMEEIIDSGPDHRILASVQEGIDKANEQAISNAQRVQKFAILPRDFSISTGELGPTMKVKRKVVAEKYKEVIDRIYEEASQQA